MDPPVHSTPCPQTIPVLAGWADLRGRVNYTQPIIAIISKD